MTCTSNIRQELHWEWPGDVTTWNPLFAVLITNAAWTLPAICTSTLSLPAKPAENLLKLLVTAPILFMMQQEVESQGFSWETDSKFGSTWMRLNMDASCGAYVSSRSSFDILLCQAHFINCFNVKGMEGTVCGWEGSSGSWTEPQICNWYAVHGRICMHWMAGCTHVYMHWMAGCIHVYMHWMAGCTHVYMHWMAGCTHVYMHYMTGWICKSVSTHKMFCLFKKKRWVYSILKTDPFQMFSRQFVMQRSGMPIYITAQLTCNGHKSMKWAP